ncbi:MAG: MFS transporter [Spirochaetes bacterium]|nr:MAG: MFS transporter [Spirochaetota bacterium]
MPDGKTETPEQVAKGKKAIRTMAFAQCIDFTEPQILNTMYVSIQATLNLADSALGSITAVKRGVETVSVFLWGILADRFRRREILAGSTLLAAIGSIITGFSQDFAFFFVVTMIANVGACAMEGQTNSVLSDIFPVQKRGKAFGVLRGMAYSGLIFSLVAFSLLADNVPDIGWRIAYWGFGVLGIIASITIWFTLDEPVRGRTEKALSDVSEDVIRKKSEGAFTISVAMRQFGIPTIAVDIVNLILMGFPKIMLVNFSVTFFVKVRGLTEGTAILVSLLGLIGFISGSITGGIVGDRMGKRMGEKMRLVTGHAVLAGLIVMTFLIFGIDYGFTAAYMVIAFFTAFMVEFMYSITRVVVSAVLLPEVRTVGFSIGRMADSMGSIIASLIYFLVVATYGIAESVLWLSVGGALAAFLMYFAYYFTFAGDAARMQKELSARVTQA